MFYSDCQLGLLARVEEKVVFPGSRGFPSISKARASSNRVLFTLPSDSADRKLGQPAANQQEPRSRTQCLARGCERLERVRGWRSRPFQVWSIRVTTMQNPGAKKAIPNTEQALRRQKARLHRGAMPLPPDPEQVLRAVKTKQSYSEKLRDPRWQRRRLEILQLDSFACGICGDSTSELHVHHRFYEKGLDPWEYKDSDLITLCSECHSDVEALALRLRVAASYRSQFGILSNAIGLIEKHPAEFMNIFSVLKKHPEKIEALNELFGGQDGI
jgi:hypothetical protein